MKKLFWAKTGMVLVLTMVQVSPVWADSTGDMMSMLESMKKQMSQMQQTIDAQNLRLQQLESKKVLETPQTSASLEPVAASPKPKESIGDLIPWLKGAKFGGDFRLRGESFDYFNKNSDAGATDRSRNRFRIRLRWGFEKDYADDWKLGFRIATGSTTDQTATNQTLGNSGYFNFKTIVLDRAYASYEPSWLKDRGALKTFKMGAGKFENPFLKYSSPIVWDSDVTPEGLYEQANFDLAHLEKTQIQLQTTAGQFLVNENAGVDTDAEIFGYQGVLSLATTSFGAQPVNAWGAVSYYDYTNWFQTVTSNSSGTSYLRTNTIVADDFRVLDLMPQVEFTWAKTPVNVWYDYASNLANVGTDDVAQSLGNDIHDADSAWGVGFKIGKAKKKGEFEWFYGYYEIGANAVVAAFNDSDFGGPGGTGFTNRKGHKLGLGYRLTDNVVVNWTGILVRPLNPSTVVASSANEDVFRSQADINYSF